MIATETLLALYPQPPHVATMWDYLEERGTADLVREAEVIFNGIASMPWMPPQRAHGFYCPVRRLGMSC